jgi:hypothetical protein
MTRLEKAVYLKEKGYSYDKETGKIYGLNQNEIVGKNKKGYITININLNKKYLLYGHHYAYYMTYGNVEYEMLDHINRDKSDNRICNLRISNHQENGFNRNAKGYYFDKNSNKYNAFIKINKKKIHLGSFNTEEEAIQSYLEGKKKYHTL